MVTWPIIKFSYVGKHHSESMILTQKIGIAGHKLF
jgi:hypothetical protein